jgi:hypothetical protein
MKMSVVIAFVLWSGVADADTPRGTYRLKAGARTETYSIRGALPSCGKDAEAFVTNVNRLEIDYGSVVKVNGGTWVVVEESVKGVVIADRDSMKPLVVSIVFKRSGKKASGVLSVLGGEIGAEPSCGDSVTLDGRYGT